MCDKSVQGEGIAQGLAGAYGAGQMVKANLRTEDGRSLNAAIGVREYSPMFIKIMLDLYVNPDCATALYYSNSPTSPQRLAMDELVRAGILELGGSEQGGIVKVREPDALRLYARAVGRVQLPKKTWVMP